MLIFPYDSLLVIARECGGDGGRVGGWGAVGRSRVTLAGGVREAGGGSGVRGHGALTNK